MFELLGYFHWCGDGGILVKCSRDSLRQANATVGSSKGWYISLMHGVPASEEQENIAAILRCIEEPTQIFFCLADVLAHDCRKIDTAKSQTEFTRDKLHGR